MTPATRIDGKNPKYDRAYVKRTDAGDLALGLSGYDRNAKRPGYVTAFFSDDGAVAFAKAILAAAEAA